MAVFIFFIKSKIKKKKIKILTIIIFVFLVWLCFSYFQTGDFLQVSGLAKHLHHSTYQINFFNIDFILFIWNNFYKNSIGWFLDFYALQNFDLTAIMLCLLIIYIFLLSNIKSSVLLLMNIAAIIYFLFYIFYMKYFAYWYFGIIYITIFLTATFFIKKINLKLWFVFLISKIKILILIFIMIYKHNNYDFNYNSIIVQEKIAEYFIQQNIKNINVGSFDSGLNGYFFSFYKNKYGINIINLDCLANNELYHQISKNKFIEFLEKNKIRYFIEGINLYNHILWLGIDQRNSFFNRLKNRHIIYYDMIISEFNSF